MRVLWVATKPPVPPTDGGRLAAFETIRALAAAGHAVTAVAAVTPAAMAASRRAAAAAGLDCDLVVAAPRPWPRAAARALLRRVPIAIARHDHAALRTRVAARLAAEPFDVVHVEQLQALAAAIPAARARGVPLVLRAQNVESEVWAARGAACRWEARRLARYEGRAVRAAAAAVALTARDAARLGALATRVAARPGAFAGAPAVVAHVPAPLPADLPAGAPLVGRPAVACLASAGWTPNDDAVAWLLARVWPAVSAALPEARLHLFGARTSSRADPGVVRHAPPTESAAAFPAGGVALVPLRIAAGVRMRILEAWARRVPVVTTTAGAAGLEDAGRATAVADDPPGIARAIALLAGDAAARAAVVEAGVAALRRHHDPATVAAALAAVYRRAGAR